MKRRRDTEEDIGFALKQVELRTPVSDVCRKLSVSEQTFYCRRNKFGGEIPSDMERLKQLKEENTKQQKLVANLCLDKAKLQDMLSEVDTACRSAGSSSLPAGQMLCQL